MPALPRPDPYDIGVDTDPPEQYGALVYPQGVTEGTEASRHYLLISVSDAGGYGGGPAGLAGKIMALYMPAMMFADTHVYESPSMSQLGGALFLNEITAAASHFGVNPQWLPKTKKSLGTTGALFATASPWVPNIELGMKLGQRPILTAQEILYANTGQRVYDFQFFFTPRSFVEAKICQDIIKTIRYYAAPEPMEEGGYILQWAAPGRFKFEIMHNNGENTQVLRIGECVVTNIEIDYTGGTENKWATFKDGIPIATRFQFKAIELEPIHREKILEGY